MENWEKLKKEVADEKGVYQAATEAVSDLFELVRAAAKETQTHMDESNAWEYAADCKEQVQQAQDMLDQMFLTIAKAINRGL